MTSTPNHLVHLRSDGVSLLLDLVDGRLPAVVHWGADLGTLTAADAAALSLAGVEPLGANTVDVPVRVALLPEHHTGWVGKPGVDGHRDGRDWSPKFVTTGVTWRGVPLGVDYLESGPGLLSVTAVAAEAGLALALDIEVLIGGLVRTRATLTNGKPGRYTVNALQTALPIPGRAREILDFAGRWGNERTPQRRVLGVGIHEREGRRGRTGADAATVLSVGERGFGFARGEVWGVHVAFSGNHRHYAERLFHGAQVVGGGELLLPGEVRLDRGESYESPWLYGAYGDGLDDQASRFHRYLRSRPSHPTRPRPVTLNVWEAVYFDHDGTRLRELADRAATLGVERYVLDDGWFRGRRDDTRGLGDWYVDEVVWPEGLHPLVDHVTSLGMEFGLWFEPEMVNEDSDLARAHPEWIMQTDERLPVRSRSQQVLNLGIPEAYDHILGRMTAILTEYDVAYVKWDHNRDLVDAGTAPGGEAGVHAQTLAAYRLMDELRMRFPGLEIEACSSGGSRVDLGIIERTDRVWVSDNSDPLDRQRINLWTRQLLPPELLGTHVAAPTNHTTGRTHELSFRAGTALFGHFGIEWDISDDSVSADDLRELAAWVTLYKGSRGLMRSGTVVRVDSADPSIQISGVVAADQRSALYFIAYLGRSEVSPVGRFTLPGLNPSTPYRVRPIVIGRSDRDFHAPPWWGVGSSAPAGTVLSGRALAVAGLQTPVSFPERVIVLSVTAEAPAGGL